MSKANKLSVRQYLHAILKVMQRSFKIAPSAAVVRIIDVIIQAVLPIITTYFAALTTTALAAAYDGDETAASQVLLLVIITALVGIISMTWSSVSSYIDQKTGYVVSIAIDYEMMKQFSNLPFPLYDDKKVIDLHEKAKRFSVYFSSIFRSIGSMLADIFSAVGAIVALIFVSPWLALIVALVVLPNIVLQLRLAQQQMKHWEGNITTRRRMWNISYMLQDSRYIAEMRIYGIAKKLIETHKKLRDSDEKQRMEFELKMIWKSLAAKIGEAVVEMGALIWVTFQIIGQLQPVGQFLYVQQMVSRAIGAAGSFANSLGTMDEDLANLLDYQRFMEIAIENNDGKKLLKTPAQIVIKNVSFHYPKSEAKVLSDVSLSISRGQTIAIVGENGAGKSTLIKLIMGLYSPVSGEILLDGTPLGDYDIASWHRQIALLGQDFAMYDFGTIYENVTLGNIRRKPTEKSVEKAMNMAEFSEVVKKLPHGANTYIEKWMARDDDSSTAIELSGGQSQRLALARNFYRDSPIIVLDEPTSAIDALAEARIFERLFKQCGKTVITISHRLTTIKKADVIYMIKDGKVVEFGSADELIESRGEFFKMFESQIK